MSVEPESFPLSSCSKPGEEIAEHTVPTEHGHTADNGHECRLENGHADVYGFSDAADMRG
jgi:hypothetical protein